MSSSIDDTRRARRAPWGPGTLVGGRFRLIAPLGSGAMGEVWRAQHETLATTIAVKMVDLAAQADPREVLGRFLQEAQAAARLQSQHVVRILDQGAEGHVAHMAMELLEGESLAARLGRRRTLTPGEVAQLMREVADGLGEAHRSGIIHRDLKPANIFFARIEDREIVKVLDFGIAKLLDAGRRDAFVQTQAGQVLGTPAYMSPEQVLGHKLDARSDLWQLGVIAFECLCGGLPFNGATLGDLFQRICSSKPPVPSHYAPVPPGFDAWFARAVAHDCEDRFSSAADLADALAATLSAGRTAQGSLSETAARRLARAARRRRSLLVGIGAGVACAALAVAALSVLAPPRESEAQGAQPSAGSRSTAPAPAAPAPDPRAAAASSASPAAPAPGSEIARPAPAAPTSSAQASPPASAAPAPGPRLPRPATRVRDRVNEELAL